MIDLTEFVPIEEFPTYLINKRGDVYSTKSNKLIKPGRKSKHVRTQTICLDGSKHYVPRVVAKTFIPNPLNLPSVKHIDGNVDNNDR